MGYKISFKVDARESSPRVKAALALAGFVREIGRNRPHPLVGEARLGEVDGVFPALHGAQNYRFRPAGTLKQQLTGPSPPLMRVSR